MVKSVSMILILAVVSALTGCQSSASNDTMANESEVQVAPKPDAESLQSERKAAIRMLNKVLLGCSKYADSHKGILPGSLQEIQSYVENPFNPDDYILVASGTVDIKKAGRIELIQQKAPLSDGSKVIAYLDYHVEVVPGN